jgi:hypothetical protein
VLVRTAFITVALFGIGACAGRSTTAGAPSASESMTPAERNPCTVAGRCMVTIDIPIDVVNQVEHAGANFRIYAGCPRTLGFRDYTSSGRAGDNRVVQRNNTSMRGAAPLVQTTEATIVMPQMAGRVATVAIFFASDPGKYAVVDFGRGPEQTVKFGYLLTGQGFINDNVSDGQNRSAERRACP